MKGTTLFSGLAITACALLAAPGAWAQEIVWDSPPNTDLPAFVDHDYPDFPDFSTYLVGHVRLDRDTIIYEITAYYTHAGDLWPLGPVESVLNIIPQGEGLPPNDYDPRGPRKGGDGANVQANMAEAANGLTLTIDLGGDLTLEAGDYWIGLTPKLEFGQFGREFHQGADVYDKNTAARNPGGGFGLGTDWFEAGPTFGGVDWGKAITVTGKNVADSCVWDLDDNDLVGVVDLILLLGAWGNPYGTEDLIELLGNWGPCP